MSKESQPSGCPPEENALCSNKELFTTHQSWLISSLAGGCYALPVALAQTMVVCPEVTEIPNVPGFVRGVVNLRDRVMPVIDLRKYLGCKSLEEEQEELCSQLDAREQDHKNWLNELEACIKEKRNFKLATDPHKCAFGRWYDAFKTEDLSFSLLLKKFDEPHKRIHQIAEHVVTRHEAGDDEGAMRIIADTRDGDLSTMIHLFDATKNAIRQSVREIIIVLERDSQRVAVTVDKLEAVEPLDTQSIEDVSFKYISSSQRAILATGKRSSGGLTLILDVDQIFCCGAAAGESIAH